MSHLNGLSPAEAERLALVVEECGEVIHAIGKILRHGDESYNPTVENSPTNRQSLEREVGDLFFVLDLLTAAHDIDTSGIIDAAKAKLGKIGQWLHHQDEEGRPKP